MSNLNRGAFLAVVVFLGSACTAAFWAAASKQNRTISIRVVGAVIAPARSSGSVWDGGIGTVPPWLTKIAVSAFNKYSGLEAVANHVTGEQVLEYEHALVSSAANGVLHEINKPDVYGQVDLLVSEQVAGRVNLPTVDNSYTPTWQGAWFQRVNWSQGPRLRVTLFDSDWPTADETIGSIEVSNGDLEAALADGKLHYVPVGGQSREQILFIAISVIPEGWTYEPTSNRTAPPQETAPSTPLTPKRIELEQRSMMMLDELADVFVGAGEDCDKLAGDLDAFHETNQELLGQLKESDAAETPDEKAAFKVRHKDEVDAAFTRMRPTAQLCAKHPGVEAALKNLTN